MTQTFIVVICILVICIVTALAIRSVMRRRALMAADSRNKLATFLVMREYAYADAGLDKLFASMETLDIPMKGAIAAVRSGDFDKAEKLLDEAEGERDVLSYLVEACIRREKGDDQGARAAARVILKPDEESRARMAAWTVLREFGDKPGETEANQVLGVVAEFLIGRNAVLISGYSDGDARLLTSSGFGMVGMMQGHPEIAEAAKALVKSAEPLVGKIPLSTGRPLPQPGEFRIAILTPSGLRATEAAIEDAASPENMLYSVWTATQNLLTSFRIVGQGMGVGVDESPE